ncbi:hypothetical protein ACFVYP_34190 [Kitasatospora sp. NPDC058201]|uniref:hypothetical protein n=1 Tax=unclassified Kitasatospora TaxID=2633591 RepID=UPI003668D0B4
MFFGAKSRRGEQFDRLQQPSADGGGGDVVAARHVAEPLVVAQDREDDQGDLPGRGLRQREPMFF